MPFDNGFLKSRRVRLLSAGFVVQAAIFYSISHGDAVELIRTFDVFPKSLGAWSLAREGVVEKEVREVLLADDLMTRTYVNPRNGYSANLFVAFFRTQRTRATPHSPKNCLPGNGWVAEKSDILQVAVPGEARPVPINHYIVSKGQERSLVLYWYQTPRRIIASEYSAKVYLVTDSIRYNRTDTALVRVIVPVRETADREALDVALGFVRDFFVPLRSHLPS